MTTTRVLISASEITDEFGVAMDTLLANIVAPHILWLNVLVGGIEPTDTDHYYADNNDGSVTYVLYIDHSMDIVDGNEYDMTPFMFNYFKNQDLTRNGILKASSPAVHKRDLKKAGLSHEQFVIQGVNVAMVPTATAFSEGGAGVEIGMTIRITLFIEDIAGFEPEGRNALELKYRYLCSNTANLDELTEWVEEDPAVGEDFIASATKDQLCQIIRDRYNF